MGSSLRPSKEVPGPVKFLVIASHLVNHPVGELPTVLLDDACAPGAVKACVLEGLGGHPYSVPVLCQTQTLDRLPLTEQLGKEGDTLSVLPMRKLRPRGHEVTERKRPVFSVVAQYL